MSSGDKHCNKPLLSKVQRGRLKKLRKRLLLKNGDDDSSSISGLKNLEDLFEFRDLVGENTVELSLLRPRILLKKKKCTCNGTDHRDLLLNILLFDSSSDRISPSDSKGKRKRIDEDSSTSDRSRPLLLLDRCLPPLPKWVRIHNPICATHTALLIFNVDNLSGDECLNDCKAMSSLVSEEGLYGRRAVALTTQLFQGDRPSDASETLMYLQAHRTLMKSEARKNDARKRRLENNLDLSGMEVDKNYELLFPLMLTQDQLQNESYPTLSDLSVHQAATDPEKMKQVNAACESIRLLTTDRANANLSCPSMDAIFPRINDRMDIVCVLAEDVICVDDSNTCRRQSIDNIRVEENYVSTFLSRGGENPSKCQIFALDCEMVLTSKGHEVARATLIRLVSTEDGDVSHEVEFDILVAPRRKVVDYLTQYSGITAKALTDVKTRIEDVQVLTLSIVHQDDILVGHSLENDLHCIRIIHKKVVDTAVLFRGKRNRKYALRHLTSVLLNREIQQKHGDCGHCSVEDAAASLSLAIRRGQKGPSFRLKSKSETRRNIVQSLEDVVDNCLGCQSYPITREVGSFVFVGSSEWIKEHAAGTRAHALECDSTDDARSKSILAWIRSEDRRRPSLLVSNLSARNTEDVSSFLSNIVKEAPLSTVMLVVVQYGFKRVQELSKLRKAKKDPRSSLTWTTEQEKKWQSSLETSRSCQVLWVS